MFDYGEVLSTRTTAVPKLAATMGVAVEPFEAAYWAERESYDRGLGDLEYWTAVGARFGAKVDEALSDELTGIDVAGWSSFAPSSRELLESLSEAGANLALLSNAPAAFGRWVRAQDWARMFRETLFSGDGRVREAGPGDFPPAAGKTRRRASGLPVLRRPSVQCGWCEGSRDPGAPVGRCRGRARRAGLTRDAMKASLPASDAGKEAFMAEVRSVSDRPAWCSSCR